MIFKMTKRWFILNILYQFVNEKVKISPTSVQCISFIHAKYTYLYGSLKHFAGGMLFSVSFECANSEKSFRQVKNKVIALSYRVLQNTFTGPKLRDNKN